MMFSLEDRLRETDKPKKEEREREDCRRSKEREGSDGEMLEIKEQGVTKREREKGREGGSEAEREREMLQKEAKCEKHSAELKTV